MDNTPFLAPLSPQNMGEGHEAISSVPSVAPVDMSCPRSGTSMVATPTIQALAYEQRQQERRDDGVKWILLSRQEEGQM